jgi:hypothetical protein
LWPSPSSPRSLPPGPWALATVPPTLRLTIDRFGRDRANIVFGWIFAGHQLGAASVAYGAGLTRTLAGSYLPAFFTSGVLCLVAALLIITVRKSRFPGAPAGAPGLGTTA